MAIRRRLSLGIHCVQEGCSFPEMVAFWRHVEALGVPFAVAITVDDV